MALGLAAVLLFVQDEAFVVLLNKGEKWNKDATFEQQAADHIKYYARLEEDGGVLLGGPFTDESGAMVIVRAANLEEARKIAEGDPCVRAGILAVQVRPWKVRFSDKGKPLMNPEHPKMKQEAPREFKVRFETTRGIFVVKVVREWAPKGADRFYNLVRAGYYDGCRFFRVLKGFVAQFGINGDPKVAAVWREAVIEDDPVKQGNRKGRITFATAGPNTRTTQLFINLADNDRLDSMGFASFGEVVEGMEVVESLYADYGEGAPRGRGPDQGRIQREGNAYLEKEFPKLDWIKTAKIVE